MQSAAPPVSMRMKDLAKASPLLESRSVQPITEEEEPSEGKEAQWGAHKAGQA